MLKFLQDNGRVLCAEWGLQKGGNTKLLTRGVLQGKGEETLLRMNGEDRARIL